MANDIWIDEVNVHDARCGGLLVSWNSRFIFVDKSFFYDNYFDGIALYASEEIQISNFFCFENDAAGLSLDNKLKNVVFNTGSIRNNGDVGIFASNSKDLNFQGLFVINNRSHGCFLSHESLGTATGVSRMFFDNCSFIDSDGFGYWLASPADESPNNPLIGSLFFGNTSGAIELHADSELFQSGNILQ